ncbi:MAG: hypothetical protein COZ70_13045 [Deltaproteobacteria bacterium CG_4_8_14_3_um_filter_51_11]|nr:hypothetical protein [bacterium]OIP37905.1 MAG: hypothetical protein AUK25_13885 [Desulfobacteraceae bacterium CG2_30_51_40]PIP47998.1 MAG: hypothetical protein COX16_02285 [Deltaproteobacteria bacterium CG23_combo_of_CG06-09_8_20_14_all_51_20]PIW00704.1 MAG: hypothetical protein COW41_04730 [Deltaproteobacteria bacterium CG17_big_fil_post_rev_8_21_14_2_50_51_6]PIX18639.1 MAG: hypothetical protein COZ70_13045 [Deltaproteobacteria bacterium CG_4_8_14_3_um_filter_51_11]PIY25219.1 MAG: hypothe
MKRFFPRFIVISALIIFTFNGVLWADICNRIVAFVNNDIITSYELENRMQKLVGTSLDQFKEKDPQGYSDARRQILNMLIDEKIAQERIKELGINISAKEIDQAIERLKEDNHWTHEDLLLRLKDQKVSLYEYKEAMKTELERVRLINHEVKSKIIVRDEDIGEYYKRHQDEFSSPSRVRLSAIFIKAASDSGGGETKSARESAKEILSRLKAGEDFSELARAFSQGPGASNGGDLGFFKVSQLDKELQEVVTEISEGGISEPIPRAGGLQIIKITQKEKGGTRNLQEVRDAIFNRLYKEEVNRRYVKWLGELRKKAYTKIIY